MNLAGASETPGGPCREIFLVETARANKQPRAPLQERSPREAFVAEWQTWTIHDIISNDLPNAIDSLTKQDANVKADIKTKVRLHIK